LQQSSHDHALHSSEQHLSNGFSLVFTRTMRQTLPRASIAVVPIVAASIKMLGTGILLTRSGSHRHHTSPYGESNNTADP
jgi:hypothetical protein